MISMRRGVRVTWVPVQSARKFSATQTHRANSQIIFIVPNLNEKLAVFSLAFGYHTYGFWNCFPEETNGNAA